MLDVLQTKRCSVSSWHKDTSANQRAETTEMARYRKWIGGAASGESTVWTDNEDELFLNTKLEYKVEKTQENAT